MEAESIIGVLPSNWERTTLGEACRRGGGGVQTGPFGSQLHASDYVPQGIPSIMPQNIGDNRVIEEGIARIRPSDAERLSRYLVAPGDIVYSRRGDVERRALVRPEQDGWLCGTGCLRVRFGDSHISPVYASYYLGHPSVRSWIVRHAHGATMPNLNTSILSALPFVVPPESEQRAIANILATLDDKIELNRRMNETLEEIARALFGSWFVDFDPVRAKAEGREPTGMDADTAALFPDGFVGSEVGEIPSDWTIGSYLDLAHLRSGGTPKTNVPEYWNGGIAWASAKDVSQAGQTFLIETERNITTRGVRESATEILPALTTVVVARGATTGRMVMIGREMAMNQTCYGLESKHATPFTLYCQLRYGIDRLVHGAHGSVFDTITTRTFATSLIVIPSARAMQNFEHRIEPLFRRILLNIEEAQSLAAMRDALLPRLLSGELQISSACSAR